MPGYAGNDRRKRGKDPGTDKRPDESSGGAAEHHHLGGQLRRVGNRKSKGLHQSRFDLVVFSKKKKAYLFTISIQYYDEKFEIEEKLKLKDFAISIFKTFEFK